MNETLTNFRQAVADSTDLQEKLRGGADLVTLGKENGYEFSQEELTAGWKELQESEEGLTEFELEVVSGGIEEAHLAANHSPSNWSGKQDRATN